MVLLALLALLSAGCLGSELSNYGVTESRSSDMSGNGAYQAEAVPAPSATTAGGQYVARESDITIRVAEGTLQSKFGSAKTMLLNNGAELSGVTYYEYSDRKEYRLTVRVPPAKFDAINEQLKAVGEVKDMSVVLEDVTKQYVDLDTRINNSRIELDRLYELYDRADNISDLLAIEREITRVETDLELLQQQKQALVSRVDRSTITVTIYEDTPATQQITPSMEGLGSLFFGALAVAVSLVVAVTGFLLPMIVVLALLWFAYKKIRGKAAKPRKPEHDQIPPPQ